MSIVYILLSFVIGFLVLSVSGMLAVWVDRKVTARLQFRVGPPWYQNFADFVKLTAKEVILPESSNRMMFVFAPIVAVIAATMAGTLLLIASRPFPGFPGDIILVLYLLTIPSMAIILGGSASGNVLASVGISREMKLLFGYELPFICAVIIPAVRSGSVISLSEIVAFQHAGGMTIGSLSGIIGFIIALFSLQGKIGYVPFDIAEAEGELASGAIIEYSGILLGFFKLAKSILLIAGPVFIIILYLGGIGFTSIGSALTGVLKYVLVLVLIILIKNTNPRLRVDQALKFFWGWLTFLGIAGVLLAIIGV